MVIAPPTSSPFGHSFNPSNYFHLNDPSNYFHLNDILYIYIYALIEWRIARVWIVWLCMSPDSELNWGAQLQVSGQHLRHPGASTLPLWKYGFVQKMYDYIWLLCMTITTVFFFYQCPSRNWWFGDSLGISSDKRFFFKELEDWEKNTLTERCDLKTHWNLRKPCMAIFGNKKCNGSEWWLFST